MPTAPRVPKGYRLVTRGLARMGDRIRYLRPFAHRWLADKECARRWGLTNWKGWDIHALSLKFNMIVARKVARPVARGKRSGK